MRYDKIEFIGDAAMVRRFNRYIQRWFNVQYPEREERFQGRLIAVTYSVIRARDFVFDSLEMLESIARLTIKMEYSHNRHAGEYVDFRITEG